MTSTQSFVCLLGFFLLATKSCHGLCVLEKNATMARCHDIEDAKYIQTYDLEILKSSVSRRSLEPQACSHFKTLKVLDLSRGNLETIKSGTFSGYGYLHYLDLSYNRLSSLPPTMITNLPKLRYLKLRSNRFVDIPPTLINATNLRTLDLVANPLNCSCASLKLRDVLLERGVHLSNRTLCQTPDNLRGKRLTEPKTELICMFEEQDNEMQGDQPLDDGSGDAVATDNDPDLEMQKITEELETPAPLLSSSAAETPSSEHETSTTTISSVTEFSVGSVADEIATPMTTSTISITQATEQINDDVLDESEIKPLVKASEDKNEHPQPVDGSGEEDDLQEGSGIEGSGTGVPPISWDVPDDDTPQESTSSEPSKTTDPGLLDMVWGLLWNTSAAPEEDKKDLALEEEEFINVSSEPPVLSSEKPPAQEEIIVPSVVKESSAGKHGSNAAVEVGQVLDDSKSGKVQIDDGAEAEATDASATRQTKKGVGSYVVLAALLGVLGVLIGLAAYKGDFCRKRRKRNDPERGTELKDMSRSLLDGGNAPQAKISSNGNLESVPLVSSPSDDSKIQDKFVEGSPDGAQTKYSTIPDVIDPVKPPRKSFAQIEEPQRVITNGKSQLELAITEPVCLRNKGPSEVAVNGNNHHDSITSLGTGSLNSPSATRSPPDFSPTNGSPGTGQALARPPLSPDAQRVKITLQENPDSVPRTPILITRTKAGENLVKTP